MRFFASCGKGLEYLLVDELIALGCEHATATSAGANVTGTLRDAQNAVMWSRLASRILWPLTEFECADEHALYAGAAAVDWPEHVVKDSTIAVDAHVGGTGITHAQYAAQRVKDAVVDVMRTRTGGRPDVDLHAPDVRLNLVVRKDRAVVSIDLSGSPMHRRGWRQRQGEAPLKENLAAAVLMRGKWPQVYAAGGDLLDPMCGSGTLLIEGALMAADVAPGLMRHEDGPPTRWPGFDLKAWADIRVDAIAREARGRLALRRAFTGRDSDPHAIASARDNAIMAGLAGLIDWAIGDISALQPIVSHAPAAPAPKRDADDDAVGRLALHATGAANVDVETGAITAAAIEEDFDAITAVADKADFDATTVATTRGTFGIPADGVVDAVPDSTAHAATPSTAVAASEVATDAISHPSTGSKASVVSYEAPAGLVVCNPPYDARLAADPALYRALGDALRRAVPTWRASLLCGDETLSRATGLRASKTYRIFNGAIECVLLVVDPVGPAQRTQVVTQTALTPGAEMVANRLRKNLRKLKSWRERDGISCFRAYDADLPEYASAIDVYVTDEAEPRIFLHVQEYAAPADIPEDDTRRRRNELLNAAREVFAVPREHIAMKTRERGKGGSKYGQLDQRGEFLLVREGAARLRVNLFDYLDTGLFLDHRPLRLRLFDEAEDARFLNLFGYTGAATVHAALGGARTTTTVDLSGTYLQWCSENLQANGLAGARHRLVQADAMTWLRADTAQYDLIFCDPPTFSNSKRVGDFDVQASHVQLLRAAVARLAPGGALYFSNNFRRFKLDDAQVSQFADVEDITAQTLPPDFERDARIHRCWRLRARAGTA